MTKLQEHLVEKDVLHCFDLWKIRVQCCFDAQREYIEEETK